MVLSILRGGDDLEDTKRRLFTRLRAEISDKRVVDAMERVPREAFVAISNPAAIYEDVPLPIGEGQTISQPYIIAYMVSSLELRRTDKVLEVGTGSGYQAAILAELAADVISVERIGSLAEPAQARLESLGYQNVRVVLAGPELGWPEEAPYNGIIVAAGAPRLPRGLMEQVDEGGRMVIPVGSLHEQQLMKITRTPEGFSVRAIEACRFVPLVGEGAWSEDELEI